MSSFPNRLMLLSDHPTALHITGAKHIYDAGLIQLAVSISIRTWTHEFGPYTEGLGWPLLAMRLGLECLRPMLRRAISVHRRSPPKSDEVRPSRMNSARLQHAAVDLELNLKDSARSSFWQ